MGTSGLGVTLRTIWARRMPPGTVGVLLLQPGRAASASAARAASRGLRAIYRSSPLGLGGGRGELASGALGGEAHAAVRAVAERLVLGMPATAERDGGPSGEAERPAFVVEENDVALDAHGPVFPDGDPHVGHERSFVPPETAILAGRAGKR